LLDDSKICAGSFMFNLDQEFTSSPICDQRWLYV